MEKQISIIIPTYNMEKYIGRCLDSLLIPEIDAVDVIIVNDGSKDRSSEIAHHYADRFPDSIRVIDKPNGNYGSCINAALPVATGRYVRILDADDWFDTEAFSMLVKDIEKINTDVVFTRCSVFYEVDGHVDPQNYKGLIYNRVIDLNTYSIPKECLKMHCITYKTAFLKKIGYYQTEGISYTDNEYVVGPLLLAENFWAVDYFLYQYRIGRDGQSVSIQSIVKNVDHYINVIQKLTTFKTLNSKRDSEIRRPLLFRLIRIVLEVFCLFRVSSKIQESAVNDILTELSKRYPEETKKLFVHCIRLLPLYYLWYVKPRLYYSIVFPIVKLKEKSNH